MKRKIALAAIMMLTILTVTGCGNNSLGDYKKAVDKTDQVVKGQYSAEFSTTLDLNTEGLSPEAVNELNYYRNISGSFRSSFDNSSNQGVYRNYLNLGGLGFDFDLYHNGDEMFVKLPIVGKYIKLDDIMQAAEQSSVKTTEMISDDTLEALGAEWVGMLKEDDVFKGKDIVLSTPDGEVKTTVYTITLNDSQVKSLEENALTIISADESLKKNFEMMIKEKTDSSDPVSFEEFIDKAREQLKKDTIEKFQYTAYVDIDGYIVNETVEVIMKKDSAKHGEPNSVEFKLDMKNWDINKDQKFEFPVLTDENTMKTNDLEQTMPSLFKDMFIINEE